MAFEVMHRNKFFAGCKRKTFCKVNADQKGADKARSGCDSNVVNFIKGHSGIGKGFFRNRNNVFGVAAGSNFRNNAAIKAVFRNLGVYYRGKDFSSVFDYCGGGFVAGRFYC